MPINSFLYPGAKTTPAYEVANSCRFNKADTAYMHKTTSAGNRRTWSFSTWLKRISLGTQVTFGVVQTSTGNDNIMAMQFTSANKLEVWDYAGGITAQITTNRLFRDTSAWMHILISADTTSGTANNRLRLYINGTEERGVGGYATDTMPSQNYDFDINQDSKVLKFGAYDGGSVGSPADFYFAETVFVDGTALSPTDVGEFDSDSPTIWKPIDVSGLSGSKGTNGFYLDYEDSSNLGNDVFGGTDLTEVNLAATDQSTDTCTNNFCTLNSISEHNDSTFSNGNLTYTGNASAVHMALGSIGVTKGKWYFEAQRITGNSAYPFVGVFNTDGTMGSYLGQTVDGWSLLMDANNNGEWRNNDTLSGTSAGTFTNGDTAMVAIDMDNGKIWFGRNGTFADSGNPSAGSGEQYSNLTGTIIAAVAVYTGASISLNFGSPPYSISSGNSDGNGHGNFEYAVPSSYFSLCTKNLSEFG